MSPCAQGWGPQDLESGAVERLFRIQVGGDGNCPQCITPRFSEAELEERERPRTERIAALEKELLGDTKATL